jgi:hypothetical protein
LSVVPDLFGAYKGSVRAFRTKSLILTPTALIRMIKLYCLDAVALQKVGGRFGWTVIGTDRRVDHVHGESPAIGEALHPSADSIVLTLADLVEVDECLSTSANRGASSGISCCQEDAFRSCASSFITSSLKRTEPLRDSIVSPGILRKGCVE